MPSAKQSTVASRPPGIAAIAIFIFVFVWNDYLVGTSSPPQRT
jgi:ABC-type glycerol-3-phosphate transport system permease component